MSGDYEGTLPLEELLKRGDFGGVDFEELGGEMMARAGKIDTVDFTRDLRSLTKQAEGQLYEFAHLMHKTPPDNIPGGV